MDHPDSRPVPSRRVTPVQLGALFVLACLGILLLMLTFAVYGLYRQGSEVLGRAGAALGGPRPPPSPTIETKAVLLQRLSDASELTTAIYTMETVIDEQQDRTLAGFVIGQTKLLYVAHGDVRAGVDLARLGPDDMTVVSRSLTVRLPPPEILDQKIDVEKSRVFDMQRSLLGPVDPAMQSRAERYALDKIVRGACEGGILNEANRRAETAVRELLEASGFQDVRVVTQPPAAGACPTAATVVPVGPP